MHRGEITMTLTQIKDRPQRISRNPKSRLAYQRRMLEALARGISPTSAARAAGLGRSTAYLWRQSDPDFAAKWDEAVAEGIDLLEEEARRRAVDGVNKRPIYHRGVQVGEIAQYSDKLLIFLLERRRPEVWSRSRNANCPAGFARSYEASEKVERKVVSSEEALARIKELGLPIPVIEGDYEELDAPDERSRSSVSAPVDEGGQELFPASRMPSKRP